MSDDDVSADTDPADDEVADPDASDPEPEADSSVSEDSPHPADEDRAADVKTWPDGSPIRNASPAHLWERVGRQAILDLMDRHLYEIQRDISEVTSALEYGAPVDEVHLLHLRDAIESLELTVEGRLVPLVDDMEPWERTVGRVPYGAMYDALEIDQRDVRTLKEMREEESEAESSEE